MEKLILFYLRRFPLEIGKKRLSSFIKLKNLKDNFVYTNPNGLKFNIFKREYVMKQIFMFGIYEKPYVTFLSSFDSNSIKNIIDIGANIGNYTIALKAAYPEAKIHSFEPNSTNFTRLKNNVDLNNFNNIKLNNCGLSNEKGTLNLYFSEANMGAASLANQAGESMEEITLSTLDNYCEEEGIRNLDLMKIDIEGGELNCLKGAERILAQSIKSAIQLEIDYGHCRRLGYTAEELFHFLLKYDYKAHILSRFGGLKAIDQLPQKFIGNVIYLKGY